MTTDNVQDLRNELSKITDGKMKVVVYREDGNTPRFLEIDGVFQTRGTPNRTDGKTVFSFNHKEPATWLFITASPADE